ncbi:MAG: LUD domain-containing protein [Halobacterium sp.]
MTATALSSFEESLAALDVPVTRTTAVAAEDDIAALVESPAVGTAVSVDDVTLPEQVSTALTPSRLEAAATGVTGADLAIGDYGSVVVAGGADGAEHVSLFADTHVAVVAASDVVASMREGVGALGDEIRDGLSSAVLATGPSATADMGELVTGAHGPTEVHVLLVTDR